MSQMVGLKLIAYYLVVVIVNINDDAGIIVTIMHHVFYLG